jgi:hypothetical protein
MAHCGAGLLLSPPRALTRRRLRSYPGLVSLATAAGAGGILPAAAVGALTLGLLAGPAGAATTWTVRPGGPVTGHSNRTTLIDTTTGTFGIFCANSLLHGKFRSGHGLPGAGLGSVTAVSFSGGCFTLTASHLPWQVNARSYASSTGTTTGTITGVHLVFTDPGFCDLVADGTGATASNGIVHFRYANGTGKLKIVRVGSTLHIYRVNGCGGTIHDGDAAALSGTYAITPAQVITGS